MKTERMKKTLNRSVGKIKRNFDMTEPENIELINNIKTQME